MKIRTFILFNFLFLGSAGVALPQTNNLDYQGSLVFNGTPANGNFDFFMLLYLSEVSTISITNGVFNDVPVQNGVFKVTLNFPLAAFDNGGRRFLEIRVKPSGNPDAPYTTLTPRQEVRSSPFSMKSFKADEANNAIQLGGVAANQYVVTTDPRMTDSRSPSAGSANYIQNTTTAQASSNFNISATGSANILDARSEYRLAGQTFMRTNEFGDTTSIGKNAGHAGTGSGNTFIGGQAGQNTSTGSDNVFIGRGAGGGNNGSGNVAVGTYNVWPIVPSNDNSYFGFLSGQFSTGNSNSFFGTDSGTGNDTGSANSAFGRGTRFLSGGLTNASAFGALAAVGQNNSIVLGSINGVNGATASTNVGIGTTTPNFRFHVKADGQDGVKIQHTGVGAYPQLRFTDSNDAFKGSVGVDTSGTGSMNFFVNGADRMILKSNGVVQVPGAIVINNPNTLVITSPNGACWGLTVSNSGALTTFPVNPCP